MVPVIFLLCAALAIIYLVRAIQTYNALKQFGGHWSVGWSRLWMLRTQGSGEMTRRFTAINKQYGSTARIAPGMLITTDPELMRRMNAVRSPFTRGPWYSALKLHPERDNITSYIDERKHADVRSRMAPGYSGKENSCLEKDVDDKLTRLHDLIREKYVSKPERGIFKTVDLSLLTSFFTLDVISKVAFGHAFGFLDANEDSFGYMENLRQMLPAIIVFGVFPELTKLLKLPIMKAALPKTTDQRGLGRAMGFAAERVGERFGPKAVVRRDMLGSFISKGLSQEELESETLTQITAGSDSTASALRLALLCVSTSPVILERLLAEFQAGVDAGRISRPIIKDSEARQLPYLQACVKECLRVYPPVTGILAKQVPPEGATINVDGVDKFAPAGTQIGWNSWGMMRHEDIFGSDVEVYRPERWLPADDSDAERARIAKMTDTVSLCFGYGRFGCLGRGVATMELNKAVVETLLRFNFQPCDIAKTFHETAVGFYIHDNMNFVVTERLTSSDREAFLETLRGDAGAIDGAYES